MIATDPEPSDARAGTLSFSDRLLLAAASRGIGADDHLLGISTSETDWPAVIRAAGANRVESLVADLLESNAWASRIDEGIRTQWRSQRMLNVFRTEMAQRQLNAAAAALAAEGVGCLLYKGLDFQKRFYADSSPRAFDDLDVIVRQHQVERAAAALEAAGYSPAFGDLPLSYYRRFHLHAVFTHSTYRRPFELHWALDSPVAERGDPVPLLFDHSEVAETFGPGVRRPSSLDAVILAAIHLDKHLGLCATLPDRWTRLAAVIEGRGLIWVVDVARWMMMYADGQPSAQVNYRVRELDAERSFTVALRLAHDLQAASLPDWARLMADRLPSGTPRIARIVYPDLTAGMRVTERGRRRRQYLFRMRPMLGFRPIRALEVILPRPGVPGVCRDPFALRITRSIKRLARITANVVAVAKARLSRLCTSG